MNRQIIAAPLEPVVVSLLEKLNDGAARVRDIALKSLLSIAACSSSIGPALVASRTLIPIQGKQKTLPRPLIGRLQVFMGLVSSYGLHGSSALSAESLLNYCKQANAFAHSNGEVREACKELCIVLQALVGTEVIEPYLSVLRPKQIEEYMLAFEKNTGHQYVPNSKETGGGLKLKHQSSAEEGKTNGGASRRAEPKQTAATMTKASPRGNLYFNLINSTLF